MVGQECQENLGRGVTTGIPGAPGLPGYPAFNFPWLTAIQLHN